MSFSKSVKEELSKITNLSNKEAVKLELIGYLITSNVTKKNNEIKYSTQSEYNINRFAKLLNNINIKKYNINIQGKVYYITIKEKLNFMENMFEKSELKLNDKIYQICNTEVLDKSLVRGSFLGSGSLNNPEKKYHLEITYSYEENLMCIKHILERYNIQIKKLNNSLYLKDGEEISKFLAFIGANSSVLKFEEIRVIRDMRNNVNRIVNCETANLNKTINTALKQIEDIKFIKKMNKFTELSDGLQEMANIRLENPDVSLIELGKMLKNPIGKSGVNYRLKNISEFANDLRKSKVNK